MRFNRLARLFILFCMAAMAVMQAEAAQLDGTVQDEQGQPIVKAMVTLRHLELSKSTTTYTDASGRYVLKVADDGLYNLRVRRIGYGTNSVSALQLHGDVQSTRNETLKTLPKKLWVHELPASDWFARVEFSSEELRGQFAIQCAMCHQQGGSTTRLSRSREDWQGIFELMAEYGAVMSQTLYDEAPRVLNAAYDLTNLDLDSFPDHSPVIDSHTDPVVITEWDVGQTTSFLHDMAIGKDGNIYTVDWIGDKLFALDPKTNAIREWDVPVGDLGHGGILGILAERGRRYMHQTPTVAPHSLQVAADGKVWITLSLGRGLATFDPATEQFVTLDHPGKAMYPHTLRLDQAGNVWYTVSMSNHLARYSPQTGEFDIWDLPTRSWSQWFIARSMGAIVWASNALGMKGKSVVSDPEMNPVPYGIDITPDGKIWFSQFNNRRIGSMDPKTEEITVIDTPFYGPRRLRADSRGVLWIPSYNQGSFYRYDPDEGEFREYKMPTGRGDMAYALAVDPRDDSIWLCGTNSDSIVHFDPVTESFAIYQLPTRVSFTRELEIDEQGNVWTSLSNMPFYQVEGGRGKLVRLSFPMKTEHE